MKKNLNQTLGRRMLSLVMVLLMAFPWVSTPAMAASDWSDLQISVSWQDGSGNTQSETASTLGWTKDPSFWVKVNSDAPFQSVTLSFSLQGHDDYQYDAGQGYGNLTLTNVRNASGLDTNNAVYINVVDGNNNQITTSPILLYISTSVAPEEPKPVSVPIIYQDGNCAELYKTSISIAPGSSAPVSVDTTQVSDKYELNDDANKTASVNEDGSFEPVIFNFKLKPVADVSVPIIYQDENGAELYKTSVPVKPGSSAPVSVDTSKVSDKYELNDDANKTASVNEDGSFEPVIFNFKLKPVADVSVPIIYQDENGAELYKTSVPVKPGSSAPVSVDTSKVSDKYELNDDANKTASVNGDGSFEPVIFNFKLKATDPVTAKVTVEYVKDNAVFYSEEKTVTAPGEQVKVDTNQTPAGYQLNSPDSVSVSVDANGNATPSKVTFSYVPKAVQKASVPIEYVKDNQVFYTTSWDIVYGGSDNIKVDTNQTPSGYQLNSPDSVSVSVDADGNAAPNKVTFTYMPVTVQKASVPIEYVKDNQVFYTTAKDIPYGGSDTVNVDNNQTPSGYQLNSPASVSVSVNANGNATPNKVTFTYVPVTVQKASVPIEYVKDNQVFYTTAKDIPYGGSDSIKVDTNQTPAGYKLNSPDSVSVSVDAQGNATPNKVTFNYIPTQVTPVTGKVTVNYSKDGSVFFSEQVDVTAPGGPVTARNDKTPAEYKLEGAASVNVTVSDQGVASPNTVTFNYVPIVTESPIPVGNPIDRWGVTNNKVNFRSSPAKNNKNLIKELPQGTHVWMYESQYNDANEVWTHVKVDGQDGYIMVEFVDMMTQAQSDGYQATLPSPMPTRSPAPTTQPTEVPQYAGYALTTKQVALRIDTSNTDQSILATLPKDTLVRVVNQVYQGTVPWSLVETLDGLTGYVPDDSLRRINQEEAKYYIDQYNAAHPTAVPATPTPSPAPVQQYGYAATLGDNVPMRGAADPNSMLVNMLAKNTVVYVSGQEYLDGTAWHIVQYKGQWGYIRADQLRWLSQQETDAYLKSLQTPTPTPANTLPPPDQNSASSYGYVTKDGVNFRSAPGGSKIGTLNKYAFALVLGSTQSDGTTWYKVNQAGREGYVSGDFFHVLSLAELEDFLQSPEYAQGTTGNTGNNNNNNTGNNNGEPPTSPEDLNVGTWTNPNTGLNATYEPFDPYATPEPIPTPTASPTPEPLATFEPLPTDPPVETQSDSPSFVWLGLGVALLGGFGGLYAYALHKSNQRKAAARAAQRRSAMQQNPQSGARPYARATNAPMVPTASGTQARPATPPTGAPKPQTPGSSTSPSPYSQRPTGAQPSGMAQRPPVARPGQPGATPAARPGQQPGAFARPMTGTQPGAQSTASYRPEAQGNAAASETGTSRQPRAARHAGNPTDQNTPTDTNENL